MGKISYTTAIELSKYKRPSIEDALRKTYIVKSNSKQTSGYITISKTLIGERIKIIEVL